MTLRLGTRIIVVALFGISSTLFAASNTPSSNLEAICSRSDNSSIRQCAADKLAASVARLKAIEDRVLKVVVAIDNDSPTSVPGSRAKHFQKAQADWTAFVESTCAFEDATVGYGGSLARFIEVTCKLRYTDLRTVELERWLHSEGLESYVTE